jgi:hypothetical protein
MKTWIFLPRCDDKKMRIYRQKMKNDSVFAG